MWNWVSVQKTLNYAEFWSFSKLIWRKFVYILIHIGNFDQFKSWFLRYTDTWFHIDHVSDICSQSSWSIVKLWRMCQVIASKSCKNADFPVFRYLVKNRIFSVTAHIYIQRKHTKKTSTNRRQGRVYARAHIHA